MLSSLGTKIGTTIKTDLQTAIALKVDSTRVLTDVPVNAKFTNYLQLEMLQMYHKFKIGNLHHVVLMPVTQLLGNPLLPLLHRHLVL